MENHRTVYIEHDRIRIYEKGQFSDVSSAELKKYPSGAVIPLSLLTVHTLKLSDRLSDEELRVQVEIRMFEEGNLNSDDEYAIDFVRHNVATDDSVLIEAFALSHTKAQEYYKEVLTKTDSIDRIVPGFMVYSALYNEPVTSNDLYLYWGEEEAYAVIYQAGVYIAHRNLETLASVSVNTGVDLPRLKTLLSTKGIVEENYDPEELNKYILIQERIAKNIERIVHTINHKRGLFGLNGIDRLLIDCNGRTIPGIESAFDVYGISGLDAVALNPEGASFDTIHDALCAEYLSTHPRVPFNLTPFPKKPAWYSRESGRFIGFLGGAAAIVLCASLGTMWMTWEAETQNEELTAQYASIRQETSALSAKLKAQKELLKRQDDQNRLLAEEISLYQGAQDTAALIRQMHRTREQFLTDATNAMGRYRLGAAMIEQNGSKEMSILAVADYRKRDDIAKLMEGLYARGYQNVQTHEIRLDANTTTYQSLIKVTR
ncbi:MAG: hypothetical protein AB7S65_12935 [Sulfuricurvum sp.]